MTPDQLRMARAKLDLDQSEVADAVGLNVKTLRNYEKGEGSPSAVNFDKLKTFYQYKGVEFTDFNGVREQPSGIIKYQGAAQFREFYDDIYAVARKGSADRPVQIGIFNGVSELVGQWLGDHLGVQVERMQKIKERFDFRVIVEEGDNAYMGASYCDYKWMPGEFFNDSTYYVYGDKFALLNFDNNDVFVDVYNQSGLAANQLLSFDLCWNHVAKETPDR